MSGFVRWEAEKKIAVRASDLLPLCVPCIH